MKGNTAMSDYCVVPPFISATVQPNIMLVLDYSGSMQWPAYLNCEGYNCTGSSSLYENYDPTKEYYGYFKSDKYYRYQNNKWYVNDSCTDTNRIGSPDCISGNLLNWATMSRVDVMRMALVGGKAGSNQCNVHTLYGEGSDWVVYDSNLNCRFEVRSPSGLAHRVSISTWSSSSGLQCTDDPARSDDFNDGVIDSKWTITDIGTQSPPVTSTVTESGGYLNVQTNGSRIWGSADRFTYVYQQVSENYFDVRVRVIRPPGELSGQQWAKAGLMVRESTATGSRHIMVNVTYYNGNRWRLQFARRSTTNGSTSTFASNVYLSSNAPVWVRLERAGNTFYAYYSLDGTNWTQHGSYTFSSFPQTVLVGMGTASYDSNISDTGVYDAFVFRTCTQTGGCRVGEITNAYLRVDVPEGRRTEGVLFDIVDKDGDCTYDDDAPRIGLMTFQGYCAQIRTGIDESSLASLLNHVQNTDPASSTPTAYAIQEVWDYFTQSDSHTSTSCNSSNNPYVKYPGSNKDPWYENGKAVPCRKSFVLLMSDGEWNAGGEPIDEVYQTHVNDLRSDMAETQTLTYYTIFEAFTSVAEDGQTAMQNIAMYGGFVDMDDSGWPYNRTGYPSPDSKSSGLLPQSPCDPYSQWEDMCKEWDKDGDGLPDNYFAASSGTELVNSIRSAFEKILKQVSAGTAVSVLASSEGSGANMLQAVFYPKRTIGTSDLLWTGVMQNLWYYIAPDVISSNIREDTVADKVLNLQDDYVVVFEFDETENKVVARRYSDDDGDGSPDTVQSTKSFEEINYLWEAGINLFNRDPDTRTIYTNINDDTTLDNFSLASASTLEGLLDVSSLDEARWVISYVRGKDVRVCSTTKSIECSSDSDCPAGESCLNIRPRTATIRIGTSDVTNTWKLGDIVYSTPVIQASLPLNDYFKRYRDESYYHFTNTTSYKNRGMVYVGANDGMLHAFRLGKLKLYEKKGSVKKAELTGTGLGEEVWAFIPRNALPYLKYLKEVDYCHLYYVDGSLLIFDASIDTTGCTTTNYWECPKTPDPSTPEVTTWRTILIGSMRFGGACRQPSSGCTDCVEVPKTDIGYSAYFALDVTDPDNPSLLWEFPSAGFTYKDWLGFSTATPAVIRVAPENPVTGEPDNIKNGRWFVIIPSGPTGPIDTTDHEFLGKSDQNLRIFILDLKTGDLLRIIDTGIQNAFGATLNNAVIDLDTDYQDDVVYIGYTKKDNTTSTWTKGGVLRLITVSGSTNRESINPNEWTIKDLIDTSVLSIGPITTSVDRMLDTVNLNLWIFFGTGRYFYKNDALQSREIIYGVKDPCYSGSLGTIDPSCTAKVTSLTDATTTPPGTVTNDGWYIRLDCAYNDTSCSGDKAPDGYGSERVITNPYSSPTGGVYFITFSPTSEVCGYGGSTYLWVVDYKTGGIAPEEELKTKVLLQLSTGEIKELSLQEALVEKKPSGSGSNAPGRRTLGLRGLPPLGEGMVVIDTPEPLREIIWIKEQ